MRNLFRWIAACIAAMACTAPSLAPPAGIVPFDLPAITFYSGGIDVLQQHDKDRALHEALLLLEQTGLDLPVPMEPSDSVSVALPVAPLRVPVPRLVPSL